MLNMPLHQLLEKAHRFKQKLHGDLVYYSVNRHVNYTDHCVARCAFCAFWKRREESHTMTVDEIIASLEPDLTEVHITGGLNPDLDIDYYISMISRIRQALPNATIKAFTATEIVFIAQQTGLSVLRLLIRLKQAGLNALPGGGAEVLSDRLHKLLFPAKAGPQEWLEVHEIAHSIGLRSNATLLFGHLETDEEIVDHLYLLRQLQDKTQGFMSFIPLPFQTQNSPLGNRVKPVSAQRILRVVALSRLFLDNFPHIKAYWVMMGQRLAAAALNAGASDIDGTVGQERVAHSAGANSPLGLAKEEIKRVILWADAQPVQRDGLYRPSTVRASNPEIA